MRFKRLGPALILVAAGVAWAAGVAGELDDNFGTNGQVTTPASGFLRAVAFQADGKLVAVGSDETVADAWVVRRYNADGTLDAIFGATPGDADDSADAVAIDQAQVDGQEVEQQRGIFVGADGDQLHFVAGTQHRMHSLEAGGLATTANPVVHELGVNGLFREVDEAHGIRWKYRQNPRLRFTCMVWRIPTRQRRLSALWCGSLPVSPLARAETPSNT